MTQAADGGALTGAPPRPASPGRLTVVLLAVACGLCVANLYYLQPILPDLADSLDIRPESLTPALAATQLGYAAGLLALVPLGDVVDRRRLVSALVSCAGVILAVIPLARGAALVALFLLLGLFSVAAMVIVPMAAGMAPAERRGQIVGTVMTGVILGALLCRTFAGLIAGLADWRAVFWCGSAAMWAVLLLLRRTLPPPSGPGQPRLSVTGYLRLLRSVGTLLRHNSELARRCLYGALGFGAFTVLWTAVPLRLAEPPYDFGASAIGLVGLLGAGGALGANLAGRFADRGRSTAVSAVAFALIAVSFAGVAAWESALLAMCAVIVLVDFAVQAAHITNQTAVFQKVEASERSRVTTAYMTSYFAGGALGSALMGPVWRNGGWPASALLGCAFGGLALALVLGHVLRTRNRPHHKGVPATDA
ncbi:MFS transporter [Streptomyces hainanensis]|uniref:MFS transporter n=1 Tax=Streptomyces hainanensis TaxID=402648 RepID=A0A4R4TJ89_9ACTN|nr:MFS transporter [Streptomyces hainanensis]TDC77881.1 MFS transporter [Streptomyces hainanensis]